VRPRERKEYTVSDNVVNVASRLESFNRQLGSQVLGPHQPPMA
jgi:hypothetical protein